MTLRAYRDFDPNDPENFNSPNQAYDTGNDAEDFKGTFLEQNNYTYAYRGQAAPVMQKSRLFMVAGILGLVAIGFAAAFTLSAQSGGGVPVIAADTTAFKTKPETPGGIEIPFQDKMVFNRLDPAGQPVQAERLLPPPEQPMTLALQPGQRQPSNPTPEEVLAVNEGAAAAAPAVVAKAIKPIEAMAPTAGAVPAPINEAPINEMPAVAEAAPAAEVAPAVPAAPRPAPVAAAKPAPVAAPAAAPAAATSAVAPTVAGGSRVQLASLPDKAAAERALSKLGSDYAGSLGGAKMGLVRAEIPGKGTFWRVQSQPMERAAAQKICNAVKAKGGACLLAK